jgi:hypothetical protein
MQQWSVGPHKISEEVPVAEVRMWKSPSALRVVKCSDHSESPTALWGPQVEGMCFSGALLTVEVSSVPGPLGASSVSPGEAALCHVVSSSQCLCLWPQVGTCP